MTDAIQTQPKMSAFSTESHGTISYVQSLRHWLSGRSLKDYEQDVLSMLPFFPDNDDLRTTKIIDTIIDDKQNTIHEFYIENKKAVPGDERHIVIVHGYGAALGFFYKNFDSLSQIPGVKIHALDLLGYGLSSRPKFPKPSNSLETQADIINDVHESENFFVDSLEEWRKRRGIEKFALVGHSFGGYLSSIYTLKYGRSVVDKLVLVSPVGVERNDFSLSGTYARNPPKGSWEAEKAVIEEEAPNIEQEFQQSQEESVNSNIKVYAPPQLPKWAVTMWEKHQSPFSLVRLFAPFGSKIVSKWSFRRFGQSESYEDLMKLHLYSLKTFTAKGSGEYALTRVLAPGALARLPLLDRLPGKLYGIPTLWMYGDNDWMKKEAGSHCVDEINKLAKADEPKSVYKVVENAGHHVYLDNPEVFDEQVRGFLGW